MNRTAAPAFARRLRRVAATTAVLIVTGALPGLISAAGAAANSPIGVLDQAAGVPGGAALVGGWVIDRDAPTTPIGVHIYADNVFVTAITANGNRPDIAAAFPGYGPAHGYATIISLAAGTHTVCAWAINVGPPAGNPMLGCKTVTIATNPVGVLDAVTQVQGNVAVGGWALDPDTTSPITVHIYADNTFATALTANGSRPDIAAAYPGYGAAHGFGGLITLGQGTHNVCAYAINVGPGNVNTPLGCRTIRLNFNPAGSLDQVIQYPGGFVVGGWAVDPDTSDPIPVDIYADGVMQSRLTASGNRPDIAAAYPGLGAAHGYGAILSYPNDGEHQICAYALNVGAGNTNPQLGCRTITLDFDPYGSVDGVYRSGANLIVAGWAADPDAPTSSISVAVSADGGAPVTVTAAASRPDVGAAVQGVGNSHGYVASMPISDTEHTVCVTAVNVGAGANSVLGCSVLNAVHVVPPSPPTNVTALGGYGSASISWVSPVSDGGAPNTFTVTASPGGAHTTVPSGSTRATVTGLASGSSYTFTVVATNIVGSSPPVTSNAITTLTSPPPQTTPAPISTSRYIRNITGAANDAATMRAEGAADAAANPSGHAYLMLLDIGGQNQSRGAVQLSATTITVSYAALVTAVNAYVDGYVSAQQPSAPATIAIGTNNDMSVSAATGGDWASKVVNPVVAHSAGYPAILIAGANDIEPGFSANPTNSAGWVSGYLASTSAPFVFNGSADGCNWTQINGGCNNGWTAAQLYWMSGGAAPSRIIGLPQIYNTTMAQQWKYISLTGITGGGAPITFGGPLTELTACQQSGGTCGSLSGGSAWSALWAALSSDARTRPISLPYSTDLRIN